MKIVYQVAILAVLLAVFACSRNPLTIDTESVQLSISYKNLDSLIDHTSVNAIQEQLLNVRVKSPEMIDYQLGYCMRLGQITDSSIAQKIVDFQKDPFIRRLENRIQERFPDLPARHSKIVDGFKHIKAHLPETKMPQSIIYMNSFFASSAFCTENEIGMGLERYLGAKTDVIQELPTEQFYEWIKQAMDPDYFERDAVCAWVITHVLPENENLNTVESMINWGKALYLTEAAFPLDEKRIIMRYSPKQFAWAMEHERLVWDFLVDQKLLFKKSEDDRANLMKEAPFTAGLPEKAPDRLGQFIGWRMIQSYMEQYDISIAELMKLPYTEILQEYQIND